MDNLCHTLLGAAFGEAGLKTRTRFGNPVLMIAANLPDIDVLAFASDTPAVALRRGWTHGVLAQALLPIVLTGLVLVFDRLRPPPPGAARARAAPVLLLSYAGVLSHVGLDWLNTYGVRLLKPFSERWFYGDAVYIIDPWLWLMLGAGVFIARRLKRTAAAWTAVTAATVYMAGMVVSAHWARQHVIDLWTREHGQPPSGLMVGPMPANPLRRSVIVDAGSHYRTGTFYPWQRRLELDGRSVPRNENHPAVIRARTDDRVRAVLVWARFPSYRLTPVDGGTRIDLRDMRFPLRVGGITLLVPGE